MKTALFVFVMFLLTVPVLSAQTTKPAPPAAKPAVTTPAEATQPPQGDQPPAFDKVQALTLENGYMKLDNLQKAQAEIIKGMQAVVAEYESQHPGWTFDLQKQQPVKKEAQPAPKK